jgi:Mismatch repair ATPase (MutS family)
MSDFFVDRQTLIDLQLLDEGRHSVFSCFNHTITYGGEDALRELFNKPLMDRRHLDERVNTIRYLMDNIGELAFDKTTVDFVDFYLKRPDYPSSFSAFRALQSVVKHYFSPTQAYYAKRRGVAEVFDVLAFIGQFCDTYPDSVKIPLFTRLRQLVDKFNENPLLTRYIGAGRKHIGRYDVERADFILRKKLRRESLELLETIYRLDAYFAVVRAARNMGLTFPEFVDAEALTLEGVYHPLLSDAVANNVVLDPRRRVSFITGANMSGKSTLMKAIGIAVYLAHLGFPVPARRMKTCLMSGLITTINLADNLAAGYSHFYHEVKRVKLVAEQVSQHDRLLVIFDELFRGTNVKDAHDSSLRIAQAFSALEKGFFIISTHIVEVAEALQHDNSIVFSYLPTRMEAGQPVFDYQLRPGVTDGRIGMWILENEGVFKLLEESRTQPPLRPLAPD